MCRVFVTRKIMSFGHNNYNDFKMYFLDAPRTVMASSENPAEHTINMKKGDDLGGHVVISFQDLVVDEGGNVDYCNVLYTENSHTGVCSTGDTPGTAHQGLE